MVTGCSPSMAGAKAQRPGPLCEILSSGDHRYARHCGGDPGVDGTDASVTMRRANEAGMQRTGDGEVVDVARGAGEEPAVLAPAQRAADRPVISGRVRIAHGRSVADCQHC